MEAGPVPASDTVYALEQLFEPPEPATSRDVVRSSLFVRTEYELTGRATVLLDRFLDAQGASCCFVRLPCSGAHIVRFTLPGEYELQTCPAGGWLLKPDRDGNVAFWIPRSPVVRSIDSRRRVLSESPVQIHGLTDPSSELTVAVEAPADFHLDWVLWRLPANLPDLWAALEHTCVLEKQPVFMWGSHTSFGGAADVYQYLVHGHVYENRFEWRHKWKICAENEAYSLYVTVLGLEAATGKRLYQLLGRQILFSVLSRQSDDGGWYHGEWSDFMESHYRLHNGALLLLAAALEERPDEVVRHALEKAASYTSSHTDQTDLGVWFLHDSLEKDLDLLRKSGSRLIPSRVLGKSPSTKLILNTHLDSIVALDRYREVTGDPCYTTQVDSARDAARALLALRPAESLYRLVYWAVGLTLLPATEADRLPLPLRAARRAARDYLLPRLHVIKRRFPRMVMPGGIVERHLSMPHFDPNYQTINLMDMVRLWRRFPEDDLARIIRGAVIAVEDTGMLRRWIESKQRQSLGYWVEATYQLCTCDSALEHRKRLAEAILHAEDAGIGLPPSLLGANPEIVRPRDRVPCPSPTDLQLRIANLSRGGKHELLVVNCGSSATEVRWESHWDHRLVWTGADGRSADMDTSPPKIGPRSWILGREPGE